MKFATELVVNALPWMFTIEAFISMRSSQRKSGSARET